MNQNPLLKMEMSFGWTQRMVPNSKSSGNFWFGTIVILHNVHCINIHEVLWVVSIKPFRFLHKYLFWFIFLQWCQQSGANFGRCEYRTIKHDIKINNIQVKYSKVAEFDPDHIYVLTMRIIKPVNNFINTLIPNNKSTSKLIPTFHY